MREENLQVHPQYMFFIISFYKLDNFVRNP